MIPRIHKRGSSFKGATRYVLHDPQKDTQDRLAWAVTLNMGDTTPDDAWKVMADTWYDRVALKRQAGVDLRGRDNTTPVLHLTLSWSTDQEPTQAQMIEAAKASLKALGIDQHQALIAAHRDTDHPHIHLIVNTIDPATGRTCDLDKSKLKLRNWAQTYEREVEPHIARRVNAELNQMPPTITPNHSPPARPSLEPQWIEPERLGRQDWIDRRDVIERMRRYRAEINHSHHVERDVVSSRHRDERREIARDAESAAQVAIAYVRDRFKSRWRDLYDAQRLEASYVVSLRDKPLGRAVYVMQNSERLGNGAPLKWAAKQQLIASPSKLEKAVMAVHGRERRLLSNVQKVERHARLIRVSQHHDQKYAALAVRQKAERQDQQAQQIALTSHVIDFRDALAELKAEAAGEKPVRTAANAPPLENDTGYIERTRADMKAFYERNASDEALARMNWRPKPTIAATFDQASNPPPPSRSEQIKKIMAEFRARHPDKDFDHEP